jgi:aryl-phospho-beta-D-glucosidase BglC (GH1 family)
VSQASTGQIPPTGWPWRGITVAGTTTTKDIEILAAMKVNAVALPLDVRLIGQSLHLTPRQAWIDRLDWADKMVDACKKFNIVCVVALYQFPIDPGLGLTQDAPGYWNDPDLQEQTVDLVGKLATHFKERGAELGAYDILSEPLVRFADGTVQTPMQWPALQDAIIRKIRQVDPSRYIITTPGFGGEPSSFLNFIPLNYPRIIYSTHMYDPHYFTHQGIGGRSMGKSYPGTDPNLSKAGLEHFLQPVVDFRNKYGAYVYIGEFSAARWASGGDQYVNDLIDLFDGDNFSWMYFTYGYHAWSPSYSDQYSGSDASGAWEKQFVGEDTQRWRILKKAFSKNP